MNVHLYPSVLQQSTLQGNPVRSARRVQKPQLGWPGFDPARPSLDILDFDHSGSVTAPGGTDPIGSRFDEAERAINTVKKWTTTNRPKVAIIHFDQPSTGNSGIVPLISADAQQRLRSSLCCPADGAGTSDLQPSLTEAEKMAIAHSDHDVRLTIFSDFALTDRDPAAVFQRLKVFPGKVHAVVLGNPPPAMLMEINVMVTTIGLTDTPGTLARAIYRSLITTRRRARL
ncbi:hypothetical protein NS206_18000 [Microbacterium testaceum]|uniref:hypothetical protein n=1 Tax=Microbacterium testaceum TaxID=2033 RepID=UPI000734C6DE|nr:hypothetical protein [Microbacterium testaceum]KTS55190.1 hypothetical protein NS206_18000 [Microbacterium testaceum]